MDLAVFNDVMPAMQCEPARLHLAARGGVIHRFKHRLDGHFEREEKALQIVAKFWRTHGRILGCTIEDAREANRVSLIEPIMVVGAETPTPRRIMARQGTYDEKTRLLRLTGDVRIDDGAGNRVATNDTVIDTRTGLVWITGVLTIVSLAAYMREWLRHMKAYGPAAPGG